jgi:uncharacterized protein
VNLFAPITRRRFLKGAAGTIAAISAVPAYATGVETMRLVVTAYQVTPPNWPRNLQLKLAVVADIHACQPWMTPSRIAHIAEVTNSLGADAIVLLGDYVAGHHWVTGQVDSAAWSTPLARLKAPLGVYSVLGNHDWWDDRTAQRTGKGPIIAQRALEAVGIPVLHNQSIRLEKQGKPFWLAGLGDQMALLRRHSGGSPRRRGVDDLPATLAQVTDNAPVVLLAHEPDIFPQVPDRVAITLSGHTHGGQIRAMGWSPVVPSRYGNRYSYGHVVDDTRHLLVSGGLGCSIAPVRLGLPPEIVLLELSAPAGAV